MSTGKIVAKNTIYQFIARIIGAALQALIVIILARTFVEHLGATEGVREMGRYTTIFAFTVLFGTCSEFGLFPTLVKEFAEKEDQSASIIAKALPLRLLVAIIVAVLGVLLALILRFEPVITIGIILLAISTLWTAVANTMVAYFQSKMLMVYPALAEIAGRVIGFAFVAVAALLNAPLLTIVILSLVGFLVTFVVNLYFLSKHQSLKWQVDTKYWKQLMRSAAPVGIVSVLALLYFKIDSVMLAAMKDKYDVGVYAIPYKLIDVLVTLPTLFVGNIFPVLARVMNDKARAQIIFRRAFDFLALVGFPIAVGAFSLAIPIIHLVGGDTYLYASSVVVAGHAVTAVDALRILIWAVLFSFFGNMLTTLVILKNLQSKFVWIAVGAAIFNIIANLIVIPRYSYFGTSISTVITEIIVAVPGWMMISKATHFRPEWSATLKALFASAIMGVILWNLQTLNFGFALVLGIFGGAAVYLVLLRILGVSIIGSLRAMSKVEVKGA